MRWARFEHEGAAVCGIVEDNAVEAVEGHADPIRPGDIVDVEITGIGTLSNPVVAGTDAVLSA